MSPTLPAKLIAKLSPLCQWRGCTADKADGAKYCAPHHEKQKGYQRKSDDRRRAKLKAKRLCRDCSARLPSRWKSGRCRACQRAQAETAKSVRLKDTARRLQNTTPARGHYKTEVFADGAQRSRYVGQSHRGGPTREEQDASLVKLVLDAKRLIDGFLLVFPGERSQIDALPRIQRSEAWELLASQLTRSARLQLEVAASLATTWRSICAGCGRAHEADAAE